MTIFFTSDTHFDDARRIRIDHRPFASIEEHDAALIARWNEAVGPGDDVYHLARQRIARGSQRPQASHHRQQ
jgi:calcineurin-like phosphoesterase family protein